METALDRERRTYPERGAAVTSEVERSEQIVGGGSAFEGLAGAGAVVLSILGLVGIVPSYMVAISAICIGAGLIAKGGAVAAASRHIAELSQGGNMDKNQIGGSSSAELFGGIAGVVLGILALIGITPMILLSSAAIVFGCALLLGSGSTAEVRHLHTGREVLHPQADYYARNSVEVASGSQAIVGIGCGVLGILALLGMVPLTLTLVAFLSAGAAAAVTGGALSGKIMSSFSH